MKYVVRFENGESFEIELDPKQQNVVRIDGEAVEMNIQGQVGGATVTTGAGHAFLGLAFEDGDLFVQLSDGSREKVRVEAADVAKWREEVEAQPPKKVSIVPDEYGAPLAGNLVEILCEEGSFIELGQPFVVIEAMKMHNSIAAPKSGVVSYKAKVGQTLRAGDLVATITPKDGEES